MKRPPKTAKIQDAGKLPIGRMKSAAMKVIKTQMLTRRFASRLFLVLVRKIPIRYTPTAPKLTNKEPIIVISFVVN